MNWNIWILILKYIIIQYILKSNVASCRVVTFSFSFILLGILYLLNDYYISNMHACMCCGVAFAHWVKASTREWGSYTVWSVTKAPLCIFLCGPEGVSSGSPDCTFKLLMFVLPLFVALLWEGNSNTLFLRQGISEDQSGWIMRHITSLPTSSIFR